MRKFALPSPGVLIAGLSVLSLVLLASCDGDESKPAIESEMDGWQNTKWGMKEQEVMKAVAGNIRKVDKGEADSTTSGTEGLKIPSYRMGNCDFEVRFIFNDSTDKLENVMLHLKQAPETISFSSKCYHETKAFLTNQYGKPFEETVKTEAKGLIKEYISEWRKGNTIILFLLGSLDVREPRYGAMIMNYGPNEFLKNKLAIKKP